jgi:L-fuconolactonase
LVHNGGVAIAALTDRPMTTNLTPSSPHLSVRPEWLALHSEDIIDPDLPIVDAHHHLWDRPENQYLLPDLRLDLGTGHSIRATVAVEAGAMYRRDGPAAMRPMGEVEFLNGIAAMSASGSYGESRVCAGIVGHADLCLGEGVRPILEAQIRAGGGRFRGVRYMSVWHPDPAARASLANPPPYVLRDAAFRRGFAQLAPLGLSFDAWMVHTQLPELVELAPAFPDTVIILNHVGGAIGVGPYAGKRESVFAEWSASIQEVSRYPNVHIKLGGLGMRLFGFDFSSRARPPTSEALAAAWRPYIETCIEAFGAKRCMFESNFPVDKGTCSYAVIWNAFKRIAIAAGASPAEKQWLFSGTASTAYRLS